MVVAVGVGQCIMHAFHVRRKRDRYREGHKERETQGDRGRQKETEGDRGRLLARSRRVWLGIGVSERLDI